MIDYIDAKIEKEAVTKSDLTITESNLKSDLIITENNLKKK